MIYTRMRSFGTVVGHSIPSCSLAIYADVDVACFMNLAIGPIQHHLAVFFEILLTFHPHKVAQRLDEWLCMHIQAAVQ
jgi:hypothetical protein